MMDFMDLAARIRAAREAAGLSVAELSDRMGLSRQIIYEWERGGVKDLKASHLLDLARVLNVSPTGSVRNTAPGRLSKWRETPFVSCAR